MGLVSVYIESFFHVADTSFVLVGRAISCLPPKFLARWFSVQEKAVMRREKNRVKSVKRCISVLLCVLVCNI